MEISRPRSGWNRDSKTHSVPEGRWKNIAPISNDAIHRPFRTKSISRHGYQPPCGWLMSVGPAGPLDSERNPGAWPRLWPISPQISFVIFHTMFLEEHQVFLLKCFGSVMFFLVGDVFLYGIHVRHAHGERTVALLPCKILFTDGFVNPARLWCVHRECFQCGCSQRIHRQPRGTSSDKIISRGICGVPPKTSRGL